MFISHISSNCSQFLCRNRTCWTLIEHKWSARELIKITDRLQPSSKHVSVQPQPSSSSQNIRVCRNGVASAMRTNLPFSNACHIRPLAAKKKQWINAIQSSTIIYHIRRLNVAPASLIPPQKVTLEQDWVIFKSVALYFPVQDQTSATLRLKCVIISHRSEVLPCFKWLKSLFTYYIMTSFIE